MRLSLRLFVHGENLKAFAASLETEERPEIRQMLLRLLVEEQAVGRVLDAERPSARFP